MSRNVAARKESGWQVVCVAPDVCKTPMGNSTPPVPYQVIAELKDCVQEVPNVRANGHPVVVFDQSKVPKTIGDSPGRATGIQSGTVEGACYPKAHSPSVRAGKKWLMCHDDEFCMNGA